MLAGNTPALFARQGGVPVGATGNDADCVLLLHGSGPNNSTIFTDYSIGRHGNAAVVGNSKVSTLVSKFGNGAMYFDGTGDSINYPNSADWAFGSANFTVECWFNRQGGFGTVQVLFGQSNATGGRVVDFDIGTNNKISAVCFSGGNPVVNITSLSTFAGSGWHHIALVRASTLFYLFIDGVTEGTASFAGSLDASGSKLSVGRLGEATTGFDYNGYIEELRISKVSRWTGDFTPPIQPYGPDPDFFTKLLLHMNGTTGSTLFFDASMYLKGYATVTGDAKVSSAQVMFGTASGLFDGAGDKISYPYNTDWEFGTGDWTIDFWVRVNAIAPTWNGLVSHIGPDLNDRLWIAIDGTTGAGNAKITVEAYRTPGPVRYIYLVDNTVPTPTGIWMHVAVVRSGTNMMLFVNGALKSTQAGFTDPMAALTGGLYIGAADADTNYPTNCFIDELRVSKGIARWTAGFSVPAAPYPPTDPALVGGNDPYTKLLCHFDGAHNSTVMVDSSLTPKANGVNNGNTYIYNPSGAVGNTLGALYNPGGGYVTFANHADWEFGNGDFTIDWWENRLGGVCAIARDLPSAMPAFILSYASGGIRQIYMTSNGSAWDIATGSTANFGSWASGVWEHLAVTRQGNTFRAFKNGVQQTTWSSSLALLANSNALCIGACQSGQNYVGSIDELRISKGIARWTANFTPPTIPYY